MVRKKKDETERTCATCRVGPEGQSDDCDDCEDFDAWAPKEPDHQVHGERLIRGLDAIEKRHSELPDDCKISVNGGPEVPFPSPEATGMIAERMATVAKEALLERAEVARKPAREVQQLDLEGKPLPEPDVEDDDETEVREFTIYRSNGLVFRIGTETLGKALELKKKESVNDRKDRIKLLVQNRSKVISSKPLDPNHWDAGTKAIYERIMAGHGRDP